MFGLFGLGFVFDISAVKKRSEGRRAKNGKNVTRGK